MNNPETLSRSLAATAALSLLAAAQIHAQTYTAEWYKGVACCGVSLEGIVTSPVSAAVSGVDRERIIGSFWSYRSGSGRSDAGALLTDGAGGNSDANAYVGRGQATWEFGDVVFSEAGGGVRAVYVQLRFDIDATITTQGAFSQGGYSLQVDAIPSNGGPPSQASIANPTLATTPTTHVTTQLSVYTNVAYTLRIRVQADGIGSRGQIGSISARTVWNAQPFVLPSAVTVSSAEAGIVNNVRSVVGPSIRPTLSATSPTVAGSDTTVTFENGAANGVGAYLFGAPPDGTSIPITSWVVLNLNPALLVSVPFVAGAGGAHSVTFPVLASWRGSAVGIQAVQAGAGTPPGLYSTNAWRMDIQ